MADCLFELTSYFFYIILDNFIGIKNLLLLEFSKKESWDEKFFSLADLYFFRHNWRFNRFDNKVLKYKNSSFANQGHFR